MRHLLSIIVASSLIFPWSSAQPQTKTLLPAPWGDHLGYVDESGRFVIPPQFGIAENFSEGFATVSFDYPGSLKSTLGIIDLAGNWVVKPQFISLSRMHEGFAAAALNDGSPPGLMSSTGNFVHIALAQVSSTNRIAVGNVSEGLADFSSDYRFGFINTAGAIIIAPKFSIVDSFHEGLSCVCQATCGGPPSTSFVDSSCSDKKCGYIDVHGQQVIPMSYSAGSAFKGGKARVCDSQNCGYLDKSGAFTPSSEVFLVEGLLGTSSIVKENPDARHVVVDEALFGYVDDSGREVIKPQFTFAQEFSEGLAAVEIGFHGTCGYIDTTGKFVLPAIFTYCNPFVHGLAAVTWPDDLDFKYITKTGHILRLSTDRSGR